MGKISSYTRALKSKLTDLFVIASDNDGTYETKAVSTADIGDAIITEETFSGLNTSDKTIEGAVNEVAGAVGTKAQIKYLELSGTTNPNGLLTFDRNKKIVSAICTTNNYVLFQIQDYVIVKHYNTFAIITNEAVKFDVYYYEP